MTIQKKTTSRDPTKVEALQQLDSTLKKYNLESALLRCVACKLPIPAHDVVILPTGGTLAGAHALHSDCAVLLT